MLQPREHSSYEKEDEFLGLHDGGQENDLANDDLQWEKIRRKVTKSERAGEMLFQNPKEEKNFTKKKRRRRKYIVKCHWQYGGYQLPWQEHFGVVVRWAWLARQGVGGEEVNRAHSFKELNCKVEQRTRLEPVSITFPNRSFFILSFLSSLLLPHSLSFLSVSRKSTLYMSKQELHCWAILLATNIFKLNTEMPAVWSSRH